MTDVIKDIDMEGISTAEAAKRLAANGPNELPTTKKRNLVQQAFDVLRERNRNMMWQLPVSLKEYKA
jgi:Ca2+-transporting ATPase